MKKVAIVIILLLIACATFSQSYLESGNAKFEAGDYDGAIEDYWKASEEEPLNPKVWHNYALAEFRLGHYGIAISNFTYALELDPIDAMSWYHRGLSYVKSDEGDEDLAIADFSKAYEIDPSLLNALYQLAHLYARMEEYNSAIAAITKYIDEGGEHLPDDYLADAYYVRAFVNNRLDNYQATTLEDLEKAAGLGKRDKFVIYEVGAWYELKGEWAQAIEAYTKVIEKDEEYMSAWRHRGLCKKFFQDKVGGCEDLHKAAALGSKDATYDIKEYCE